MKTYFNGWWFITREKKGEFHLFRPNENTSICDEHLPLRLSLPPNSKIPPVALSECQQCQEQQKLVSIMEELAE